MNKLNIFDTSNKKSQTTAISLRNGCLFNAQLKTDNGPTLYADLTQVPASIEDWEPKYWMHALRTPDIEAGLAVANEIVQLVVKKWSDYKVFVGALNDHSSTVFLLMNRQKVQVLVVGDNPSGKEPLTLRDGRGYSFGFIDYE